jgi:hypothetical protein
MVLSAEDVAAIETVTHYTHDEDQCYCMLYGEGVFDTIPIEADYTVGDMRLWIKTHKGKADSEYDMVGPKGVWKMGAGSEVLGNDVLIADVMGPRCARAAPPSITRAAHHTVCPHFRFENKWLMQLSLFPKKKNEETGEMESTFETVEEWVPPPPEEAWESEREREANQSNDSDSDEAPEVNENGDKKKE